MSGIYIASKSKHGARWRALREAGIPIISTRIDEAGEGETSDWQDLWDRCIQEASSATAFIMYVENGEIHKGSLVELGAALHAGVPVLWVGPEYSTAPRHWLVRRVATIDEALVLAGQRREAGVAVAAERPFALPGLRPAEEVAREMVWRTPDGYCAGYARKISGGAYAGR